MNSWVATSTANVPTARDSHTAVWTGSEVVVWGGYDGYSASYLNTGGRYNPGTDSWTATSVANAPTARARHTAVWTGNEMIIWGGSNDTNSFNTGGRYNSATNSWIATSITNAPSGRESHTALWTGSQMIVWGGLAIGGGGNLRVGGRYNPSTNSWTATSTTNAPSGLSGHTAVWASSEMIVWGGFDGINSVNTGGRYNPSTNTWTATSTTNAPSARYSHSAVWGDGEMIVWGGGGNSHLFNTGGKYNPGTDSWSATSTINAPAARFFHTAVWTGNEMIVWGGADSSNTLNTGGRYNPSTDSWIATSTTNVLIARENHTAVWTGNEMIVWGGQPLSYFSGTTNTGGRYCAQFSATGAPVVTTSAVTYVASFSATLNGLLNPHGLATTVSFQYGPTISYGFTTPIQTHTGNTFQNISANISGLIASHIYHFRIVAHNSEGTSFGSDRAFTTLSATGPPVVTTSAPTYVASFSATLNGSVDPHGLTTSVHFQYGTTTSYGLATATQSKTGNTYQNVAANINGLTASTTYHFRMVAMNSAGTRYGSDRTFTTLSATGAPVVTTNPATNVASSSATLNGSLDPHGLTTSVHFQYGTTTNYGHFTPVEEFQTGNTFRNVRANISGLTTHTAYHFRIVATNGGGTRYGSDRTFTTTQ